MPNINSFTENVEQLINQVNIAMEAMVKLNESVTTENDVVNIEVEQEDLITGDASTVTYSIPSYNYVLNKLNALSQTMDTFLKGEGVVLLNDGTYRQISATPVAVSPNKITGVPTPTKFSPKTNWFFENMMSPQLMVSFNLKNKIDDRSDRVMVKRVIFNNSTEEETTWFKTNVMGYERSYYDTITYLTEQGKEYWESEEIQDLPLLTEPYTGYFIIMDKRTISGKEWFYLDTTNYGVTSDEPIVKDHQLTVGDSLRYGNSIWKIDEIQINEKRVHLIPYVGLDHPTINNSFEIYSTPFSTKILDIPVGYNECEILFLKGVNDDFNIIADEWSNGIAFYTDELILSNGSATLKDYYNTYIFDYKKQVEGQVRENFVPAYFGEIPNTPVLGSAKFEVVQINTQLNAALDSDAVLNIRADITRTQSEMESLNKTIADRTAQMVEETDPGQRAELQFKIKQDRKQYESLEIYYNSLVKNLTTISTENSAVTTEPKYRIRGFYPIPEPKGTPLQYVIQFESAYRYLKLDNTGTALNNFEYVDPSTGQTVKGVYTDWVIHKSEVREKVYDETLGIYVWKDENISDGDAVNINQIDIPIQPGEKVQIKSRSISESGWPLNPLKSPWSEAIIVEFPANIETGNQIANILKDALVEDAAIKLNETLASAGITTHVEDSIPNPNSGTGTYFKHQSQFIAVDLPTKDMVGNIISEQTVDLQSTMENLPNKLYVSLSKPSNAGGSAPAALSVTLQQFFQAIVNADPSIYNSMAFYYE